VPVSSTILSGQGDTLIVLKLGSTPGMLTVVDSNLCGNSAVTAINLNVKAAPAIPVITQNFNVLNSGSPVGNQWYFNGVSISGETLELSTADLSESLVNLMVFQRAFEANAKSITTSDELLNTLINLKR